MRILSAQAHKGVAMSSKANKKRVENRSKYYERKARLNRLYTCAISTGLALTLYFLVVIVSIALFSGCVKYVDREVPVPYEVSVSVPMKCKFDLQMPPRVDTSNLQKLLDSSTAILKYDAELYNAIKKVPCLELER